ncbi:MAG: asparagine synthase (glutamine-hydrolyzing) [Terrisporobacter sp.]
MCGFVGFLDNTLNKEEILDNMLDTIIHRGPDQKNNFIDNNIALGFRRLSIIGVDNGTQPLFNEDNSLALVFNGEIYNYKELRYELINKGHIFKTNTDSEVLVHCYEEFGNDMVHKLRGMFAFVIYDINNKNIFAARDHFGIKPFYYYKTDANGLLFGSEIKSFLKHPGFRKEINEDALKPYLTFQYSVLEETFFKGVFKLQPGCFLTFKNSVISTTQYWDINFNQKNISLEQSVNAIENVIEESVEIHKDSEVPVGSFLSGGVDSSYITAKLLPEKSFTVGFEQDGFNESNLAKELSDSLNIDNIQKIVTADECFDKLSDIQYHMDEPQSNLSSLPLYFLSEVARQHVTVVLSGEGADEIFGGYEWYNDGDTMTKYKKIPYTFRKTAASIAKKLPHFKGRTTIIKGGSKVEDYFIGQALIFEENEASKILKPKYTKSKSIKEITRPIYDKVKNQDDVTKKQYLDLKLWLQGDILLKADKMSMAHSLELRVPFLDKEVMKVGESIPTIYKVNDKTTKLALREAALKNLPEEWAKRDKKGFPVPLKFWLKEEKYYNIVKESFSSDYASEFFNTSDLINLLDDHYNNKTNNARKIYTIYVFLVWYKRFFIEEN